LEELMRIDFYTKLVLTVIATCLLVLAARSGPWVERAAAQPSISCQGQLKANPFGGTTANKGGYQIVVTCR
jgi:hypothetical protein